MKKKYMLPLVKVIRISTAYIMVGSVIGEHVMEDEYLDENIDAL